jgi:hypothetical protein
MNLILIKTLRGKKMKLVKKKFYTSDGEAKINNYFCYISKSVVEQAKFTGEENIKVYADKNRIIIEKE